MATNNNHGSSSGGGGGSSSHSVRWLELVSFRPRRLISIAALSSTPNVPATRWYVFYLDYRTKLRPKPAAIPITTAAAVSR
jgi:hypothetical protein